MIQLIRSSLRWKLLALILSIIFFLIVAIGIFSYVETSSTIDEDVERFSNQILKQANLNLTRYFRDTENFFITLAGSEEFSDWMRVPEGNVYAQYQAFQNIRMRYIEPFVRYHPEVLAVKLYHNNTNESIYRTARIDYGLILRTDYTLAAEPWLEQVAVDGRIRRFVEHSTNYTDLIGRPVESPVMTYVQQFREYERAAYVAIDLSLIPSQEILQEIQLGDEGVSLITDENGTILAHDDDVYINTPIDPALFERVRNANSGKFFVEKTDQMVVFQTVPRTNWKVMVMVPYEDVGRSIFRVRDMTIVIAAFGMVLATILVFIVSGSITKRLKELQRTIKMTEAGRFDNRVSIRGIDEISYLGHTYNHLLERIDTSIRDLTESRIMQQEAALSALQSQINSHFLYNALESINAMANLADQPEIQKTSLALSHMLRYTSDYKESTVTLQQEFKHVSDYLYIIDILYGDHVSFVLELPEELREVRCAKAILQPLVENCLKHGFEVTGEPLRIEVRAMRWKLNYVRMDIIDNGRGFSPEKLAEVQQQLAEVKPERDYTQLSRIGLLNVHYRLKMKDRRPEIGISIVCPAEGGTHISVVVPL